MKYAGLLYGLDLHHLDHIAPLSALLRIPLLCTDTGPSELAKEFYPHLQVKLCSNTEEIVSEYDTLFTCLPKALFDPIFFFDQHKLRKKLHSVWLPHGNSDKDNLGALAQEKLLLIYGEQMATVLKVKGVTAPTITISNFRKHFFEQNRSFYNTLLGKRLSFNNSHKTLLYAPTWNHSDVAQALPLLLKNLPDTYNLFVKLHPNTLAKLPQLTEQYSDKDNIRFINNLPTIFPLLDKTDALITDTSSIAYDYLSYDRPLYFFTADRTPIHRTGYISTPHTLFEDLKRPDIFDDARKELYPYAFSSTFPKNLLSMIDEQLDSGLNFL